MSVIQRLCLRYNGPGAWLYSVTTNTNSVCTITRNVFPVVNTVQFPTCEKNLYPHTKIQRFQEAEKGSIKDYLSSPIYINFSCPKNSLSRNKILPDNILHQHDEKEKVKLDDGWLSIGHGLFYNTSDPQAECYSGSNRTKFINNFSSTKEKREAEKGKEAKNNGLPSEETLENTAAILTRDLTGFFVQRPDYNIFRHDLVFENRIHNKVISSEREYVNRRKWLHPLVGFKYTGTYRFYLSNICNFRL